MTLKEFCSIYGGVSMCIYIPRENMFNIQTMNEYRSALNTYGNYRVTYFDIYAYSNNVYSLNVTLEK